MAPGRTGAVASDEKKWVFIGSTMHDAKRAYVSGMAGAKPRGSRPQPERKRTDVVSLVTHKLGVGNLSDMQKPECAGKRST